MDNEGDINEKNKLNDSKSQDAEITEIKEDKKDTENNNNKISTPPKNDDKDNLMKIFGFRKNVFKKKQNEEIKENEINKNNESINKKEKNEISEIKEEPNDINKQEDKNEIIIGENEYINITKDEGIKKRILKEGQGNNPKDGNEVAINYIGRYNNEIFEHTKENESFSFILGEDKVMKGWELAVRTMKLGEKSEFIMTPEYTYKDKQINENVPPNSILNYTIELKSIHYKTTEESLDNLTYEEKLQWGKLLKQDGIQKFKEKNISGAKESFIKALSFLKTINTEKEEEKEGVDLFLTILSNICYCYNQEKDYDSVINFAMIGMNIRAMPKLLYFRTIAYANLEEFIKAENDLNDLIALFASKGEENSQEVNDTVNHLRELIDSRKKIYEEKNKKFSRSIYRLVFHHNKTKESKIIVPPQIPNPHNPVVFFEIQIENDIVGKIEFELFKDVVPITVENFRNICIGTENELTYKNTYFDKVIKDFVIGGGKIENFQGVNKCIYGEYFDDENYLYCHCRRGLLTMDNDGKNKNNSKFFITLKHIPWFDGKHVVFGQVVNGIEIIKQIEDIDTDNEDRPLKKVKIINCGEIIKINIETNKDVNDKNIEGNMENDKEGKKTSEKKNNENLELNQEKIENKIENEVNEFKDKKKEENESEIEENKIEINEKENTNLENKEIK